MASNRIVIGIPDLDAATEMFHVKHEGWEAVPDLEGLTLDASARSRLELFEQMLLERALPMGMVASTDGPRIRERHLLDSLRAAPLLPEAGVVCDLGSGAGLPGLVLSIARPDLSLVLIEVRRNRAAFLKDMIAALELDAVVVHARRVETFRQKVDVCTARAFAPAGASWKAAQPLLVPEGFLVYWAGASFDESRDVPVGVDARLFTSAGLAPSGPLVIMTR